MDFFQTSEIKGEKPFKCPVCEKLLLIKVSPPAKLELKCSRCKTYMKLILKKLEIIDNLNKKEEINL